MDILFTIREVSAPDPSSRVEMGNVGLQVRNAIAGHGGLSLSALPKQLPIFATNLLLDEITLVATSLCVRHEIGRFHRP